MMMVQELELLQVVEKDELLDLVVQQVMQMGRHLRQQAYTDDRQH